MTECATCWDVASAPSRPAYVNACWLFSKLFPLIYAVAFASFAVQVNGLIGSGGILPVERFLESVHAQLGAAAYYELPTVLWGLHGDVALRAVCWLGVAIAIGAIIAPAHGVIQRSFFVLLYILYLSLVAGGQVFMGYQWDALLLETGFLAIFLKPDRMRVLLFQWLLFRLMFESGAVKLLSHDPHWKDLTALSYHFETQPLPTPLAWYLAQAPMWFQRTSTLLVFFVELVLPFFMFGPRRLQIFAAAGTVGLQVLIFLTGNYTYFNLVTILLCLFLFSDVREPRSESRGRARDWVSAALIAFTAFFGLTSLASMFGIAVPSGLRSLEARIAPFELVNQYGLFANMTTTRNEISIEGSDDGSNWKQYVFKYKPEALNRAPRWVAPHQPRLDWQMWFAALEDPRQTPWFQSFLLRLLHASPPVLSLLERDPFAGKPPRFVRALFYEYHFTGWETRRKTGNWWRRELRGAYFPAVSLNDSVAGLY
jgi:hypothetical protein